MARQHSAEYMAYLDSDRWRILRAEVIRRAGHRGEACGSAARLDVHHANGYRNFGREQPEELQALCRSCHKWVHAPREMVNAGCLRTLSRVVVIAIGLELAWSALMAVLRHFGVL